MPKCLSMHCSFLSVICLVMQAVMIRRISGFSASRSFLQHSRRASKFAATTSTLSDEVNVEEPSEIPKSFQSSFLQVMSERGYLHQCTDFANLDRKLHTSLVSAYLGFDATAKSLHVGSLLQIMILRHLQKSGHKPVVLVGGGTTKVGDPTGKDESRKLLTNEVIQENIDSLSQVFSRFITFGDGPTDAVLVNNADWLDQLNYLNFLRDYGRLFTINRMMSFESVKQRLAREQPFSFLEFNYMLLQSYDFVELFRRFHSTTRIPLYPFHVLQCLYQYRHETCLQLGGSDQWGNIVSGVELGRKLSLGPLYGLTAPLITTSDGKKMGKTAAGAVWLNKCVVKKSKRSIDVHDNVLLLMRIIHMISLHISVRVLCSQPQLVLVILSLPFSTGGPPSFLLTILSLLAVCAQRAPARVRLLAVLAQHSGCRCHQVTPFIPS